MPKPIKWPVRRAKTQISLGIRSIWSESSLSAQRSIGSSATYWAHSKDSDQTGRMPRPNWVFAGRTGHIVDFVMLRLQEDHSKSRWFFVYKWLVTCVVDT